MGMPGTEPQSRISGTVARWHDFCLPDLYQTVINPQTVVFSALALPSLLSPFFLRYSATEISMHRAVGLHRNYSATSDVSSRSDPDSTTWAAVAHPHSSYAMGSNPASSRSPREYKPPRLSSTELAHMSYLRTGSYPMGNAFTRESATRFDDKRDMEGDPDEDEDEEPSRRMSLGSEEGSSNRPEEYSDDDAYVPDLFCTSRSAYTFLQL